MMTVEEISSLVAQRLLQGSMNHQAFAKYYSFLGLDGYKLFHEYQYYEQTCSYLKFTFYFMQHYSKLLPKFSTQTLSTFSIVPDNWYEYSREDMDINTRRSAVKNGLEKYLHWQKETKKVFEDMYTQYFTIGEQTLALKMKQFLDSVDKEIKKAELCYLEISSTDYDMPTVIAQQEKLKKKYGKKLEQLRKDLDDVEFKRN